MYLSFIALVALASLVNAFGCLHHVCMAAFKTCNATGHITQECWDWADDTFHCCGECSTCDSKFTKDKEFDRECRPHMCDAIFGVCNRVHSNSSDCLERADQAAHCCYACLNCPSTHRAQFIPHAERTQHRCASKLCNAVYVACTETEHTPQECLQVANDASDCCDACDACGASKPKEPEHKCADELCHKVFDICHEIHPDNSSTNCWERADIAFHCCFNCVDCSSNFEPAKPKYDHCLSDLCNKVYHTCLDSDHSTGKCREVANHASDCCNMCDDCRPPTS